MTCVSSKVLHWFWVTSKKNQKIFHPLPPRLHASLDQSSLNVSPEPHLAFQSWFCMRDTLSSSLRRLRKEAWMNYIPHPSITPALFLLRIPLSCLALPLPGSLVLPLCLSMCSNGRVNRGKSTVQAKDTTSRWGWVTRLGSERQKSLSVRFRKLKRRSRALRS